MKPVITALWRLFQAYMFYPVMIGLFLWVYVTNKHWIFGVLIIAAILIFDPIWRVLFKQLLKPLRRKKK